MDAFVNVGVPYIEAHRTMDAAYEVLSRDDRDSWLHCPIHLERAKRACALLVAIGRESEVDVLGDRKLAFLKSINDPGAASLRVFLGELAEARKGR